MEDAAHEHRHFVDVEIGGVILISDWSDDNEAREDLTKIEEAEPGRYLQIPRAESREGYADMQEFIDTISDKRLRELLDVATQGRGAFRRFKDVLTRHPAEQQRWFNFQKARLEVRGREWLATEGYESQ